MPDSEYINSLEYVRDKIESEGFDYAFRYWSDFKDVKDREFHRLRKAYVDAAEALDDYIPKFDDEEFDDDEDNEDDTEEEDIET